jgi:uncharacterized protein (TIGR02677 family)
MSVAHDKIAGVTEQETQATGVYAPFAYLATPNAPLYRRVMRALVVEKERFAVHVRPEQVHAALRSDGGEPVTPEAVAQAMERLADPAWGNLLAFPDSSRVTALEDFYRRRMLYQLSRAGEAAERALTRYDESLGSRGALQAVALEDIVVLLTSLRERAAEHASHPDVEPDRAAIHQTMLSLRTRFTDLAENAVDFMGSVQRTIDLRDADVEAFLAYKERLIDYLQRFLDDLVTRGDEIARILRDLPGVRVDFLCALAGEREARDAAPGDEQEAMAAVAAVWRRQWQGLVDWFIDSPGRESEAKLLRARARAAIPTLLAVVGALHERGAGRTDRARDFVALAGFFAALPDDASRHRLWRTAFGLTSARHLTVTPQTLDAWQERPDIASLSWAQAPPVEISPQLRKTGQYERRGKANRVQDRSEARALLAAHARAEAEQVAAARRRVLTHGPRLLSELAELDTEAFRLFLALLGDGLAALLPGQDRAEVQTSDGELRVVLTRVEGAGEATLRTPDGILTGPDLLVDVEPTVDASRSCTERPEAGPSGAPLGDGRAERALQEAWT